MLGQHESPQIEAQSRTEFPTSPGNSLAREDPDAILTGGRGEGVVFNEGSGMVGDGALSSPTTAAAASMAATVEGPYSLLVPHLLELVAYQSGVEAVEVSFGVLAFCSRCEVNCSTVVCWIRVLLSCTAQRYVLSIAGLMYIYNAY